MHSTASRYLSGFLIVVLGVVAAMPMAHAAPQQNPSGDQQRFRVCSNLGVYIFVGGTGGFDALRDGDQFEALLKTGHVGLYEHAYAIVAAEESPDLIDAVE